MREAPNQKRLHGFSLESGMKKTPLRRISRKRKPEYQAYLRERDEFLKDKLCECPPSDWMPSCDKPATTVHHIKGRRGKMLRDKMWWLPVCFEHHREIHAHGRWARDHHLIIDDYEVH